MIHQFKKNKTCNNSQDCINEIVTLLENQFTCKLMARNVEDHLHGYVSVLHTPNNHDIKIEFYDKNEAPNEVHQSTFTKLDKIPNEQECNECLRI
jgi:hypothetical protein